MGWPHSLVGYIRFPDEPQSTRRIWGTRLVGGWPIRQMPVNAYFYWLCESCSYKYDLQFSEQGVSGVVPINTQHSQHGSEPEHGLVRRIFINRPPPGFLEATVDYAGLERETPHPAMSVALPAGNLGENTQRTGTTQSEAAQTTQLASKST